MDRTRTAFIIVMCLTGLVLAGLVSAQPSLRAGAVPILFWIVLVVMLFDVATLALGRRLGLSRLTSGLRLAGLISGAIVYLLADLAFSALRAPVA